MLNMDQKLIKRQEEGKIIKTGIVGAGQMGRGMVTQMVLMNGITPAIVSDIKVENAVHAFKYAGVSDEDIVIAKTLADANAAMEAGKYTHLIVALELMAIIASLVLVAAAVTACILSYYKSKKTGQKFFSRLTYRALWNFSLPMLTGGVLCISIMMHEYYDILASVMLLFYGLALVNVSKFTYSSIVWLGYAFICLGVVDCFWEGHSLLFWTIGFGGFHILYGILFYLHYERKRS